MQSFSFCAPELRWLLCAMNRCPGFCHLLVIIATLALTQRGQAQSAPVADSATMTEAQKREAIIPLLTEAQSLQNRKRYIDALFKLADAEKIAPDLAEVYNI